MPGNWLDAKSIVIIGGSTGIGLSAARAFVAHGAKVVAVGRTAESLEETSSVLAAQGRVLQGDASLPDTAKEAIGICRKEFGSFDGLYHVAGGSGRKFGDGPVHDMTVEAWNKTLSLNLTSLMLSNQAAINAFMAQRTGGTILNMGSVLGFSPSPGHFVTHAYAAAKSAVIGFTKSIASYYAAMNIRINLLAPGLVETPMATRAASDPLILDFIKSKQPLEGGRIGIPTDLDGAAIYFMSDFSRYTTGQLLAVDGGWSVSEGKN